MERLERFLANYSTLKFIFTAKTDDQEAEACLGSKAEVRYSSVDHSIILCFVLKILEESFFLDCGKTAHGRGAVLYNSPIVVHQGLAVPQTCA